ncbi:MAG: prenyltransferase [Ktedonobacteraceae bacterium]|nr:prenyltransferase [Ktedonobacteraceae bacterium]MBO0793537.1 prenyltransferase [Ktedonobacteraceae bacterium]
MENEEVKPTIAEASPAKVTNSSHVVMADSVKAEEVPTISIKDLQTISELHPEVLVHSVASTKRVSMPTPLVVQPAEYRHSIGEWMQIWRDGMRLVYLPLALAPALLGSLLAWAQTVTHQTPLGQFHILHFIATIAALCFVQIGANLLNDYYDYLRGIDTGNPLGPGGLIQQGLIKPALVLIFGLSLLGLGAVIGILAALRGGPLVLLFGLVGVLCAYFYSATLRSLSSLALGELVSFCIFGPLITLGAYMVQAGPSMANLLSVLLYSLIPGFLAVAVIHANNIRDFEGDEHAKKYTLAVLLGPRWSKLLYLLLVAAAYTVVLILGLPHGAPHLLLITFWTLPGAIIMVTGMLRTDIMQSQHLVLRQTLRLGAFFTFLLLAALFVNTLIPVLPEIPLELFR